MLTMRLLGPYFWPRGQFGLRVRVVLTILLLAASRGLNVVAPFALGNAVDWLSRTESTWTTDDKSGYATNWLLAWAGVSIVVSLIKEFQNTVFMPVSQYATKALIVQCFNHVQNLSLHFHLSRQTGALLAILTRTINSLSMLQRTILFTLAPTLVEFVIVLFVLLGAFGWQYMLVTLISLVLYVAFTVRITAWRNNVRRELNNKQNVANQCITDALINFETVKLFTQERRETNRYADRLQLYFGSELKTTWSLGLLNWGQTFIVCAAKLTVLLIAIHQVLYGHASVGDLFALQQFMAQLFQPLGFLGSSYRMMMGAFTDVENIFDLLDEESSVSQAPDAAHLKVARGSGRVEFRDVVFAYPGSRGGGSGGGGGDDDGGKTGSKKDAALTLETSARKKKAQSAGPVNVLKGISFTIEPGTKLAIVGSSGAGKSTISRLLLRFYDPDQGAVLIDGVDVRDVTLRSLRRNIGVVPQDTSLFNQTLGYNIEYGREDCTPDDIRQAAAGAQLDQFLSSDRCPDGYDTLVGERGLRLSGGEKQRVAIARCLLKDPPIVILDEATSALDSKTEQQIKGALDNVAEGRTTLIIAHRLSTIRDVDKIIVLSDGRIVERGTHDDLMKIENGLYRDLWETQSQEHSVNQRKQQLLKSMEISRPAAPSNQQQADVDDVDDDDSDDDDNDDDSAKTKDVGLIDI